MGIFTSDIQNLRELYEAKLSRALSSERQIVEEGLPAMIKEATSPELKQAFEQHLEESRVHITRLEGILDALEGEANDTKCKITAAMIAETGSLAKDAKDPQVRDVLLIASGNGVEHHEIAIYGTLRTWADVLGEAEAAALLEKTLEEEKRADELLTELSQQINIEASVA